MGKVCKKCGAERDLGWFGKRRSAKDGLSAYCRVCINLYNKNHRKGIDVVVKKKKDEQERREFRASNPFGVNEKKICKTCKEEKHPSCFTVRLASTDGLAYNCKDCANRKVKKRLDDTEKERKKSPIIMTTKVCSTCKTPKKVSCFTKNRGRGDGYFSQCTECKNKARSDKKSKEAAKKYNKKYKFANKEILKGKRKTWTGNNPDKVRAMSRTRRARKEEVKENYMSSDETFTKDLFDHRCFLCGSGSDLAIDHHFPLSKGHALTRENAVLLCKSCNSLKGAKLPEEFYLADKLLELEKILGIYIEETK